MNETWDRRRFLKRLGLAGTGIVGSTAVGLVAADRGRDEPLPERRASQVRDYRDGLEIESPARLIVSHGDPEAATAAAIEALGGMGRFVKPGESVVVKPNVGWDRTPVQAANTNPLVVGTLVRLCREAGASRVTVTDHTCNDPTRCFSRSGIGAAVEAAGGEVVLPADHRFRPYRLGGKILGEMPVLVPSVQADRFINAPVAKHHGLSGFTGAMKNLYGVLGGRRNRLHQRIDDSIADLADFIRPTLTVMDATRVLVRNGPQGGDVADTEQKNQVIASTDQVAVDAWSCRLIGLQPEDLPFLALAEERGLGIADLERVPREEIGG